MKTEMKIQFEYQDTSRAEWHTMTAEIVPNGELLLTDEKGKQFQIPTDAFQKICTAMEMFGYNNFWYKFERKK